MRIITLTKVSTVYAQRSGFDPAFSDSDEPGEGSAPVVDTGPTEVGSPVFVNVEAIRCFYARKEGKVGTRLTFNDGGGFAVSETPEVVLGMVNGQSLN